MVATGRKEFSDQIWPLIATTDNQVYLHALRAVYPFRPNVLGTDVQKKIETLSEDVRADVISEIAGNSRMDGIALATALAVTDPSVKVKVSVVEALIFRRADRFAAQVLDASPDQVWFQLAEKWHPDEFADPKIAARIEKEASKIHEQKSDPVRSLNTLLRTNVREPEKDGQVQALVQKIDFSEKRQDSGWLIARAGQVYPDAVAAAMISNLEVGKEVPYQAEEILFGSDIVVDDGPLVDRVIKGTAEIDEVITAAAGPKTVGLLIDELLKLSREIKANGKYDKALSEQSHRLMGRISKTKVDALAEALLSRSVKEEPSDIPVLAELIARHGRRDDVGPIKFAAKDSERIIKLLDGWARVLLGSPKASRADFADIAQAAERLSSPELVPVLLELLSEDLKRRKQALEEFRKAQQERREYHGDAQMSWTEQYKRAFGAIGGDQAVNAMKTHLRSSDFGHEAAIVLKMIWRKGQPSEDSRIFKPSPDFSVVPEAHAMRRTRGESHPFFLDILEAIKDLTKPHSTEQDHRLAIRLATVAFGLPYDNHDATIADLLRLPLPISEKLDFLTALALSGQTLSSELVLNGIDNLLEEAKTKTWLMDQDGWRLKKWLQLLAFTDKPMAILDVLKRADGFNKAPWNLREILFALTYAPSAEAEVVLDELAKQDISLMNEYDWSIALLRRGTLTASNILLDQTCRNHVKGNDSGGLSKTLSGLMRSQPSFRNEVYERYEKLEDGAAKSLLEHTIAEVADGEGILLLLRIAASKRKPFDATAIRWGIQEFLIDRSSSGTKANGIQAGKLRKELFAFFLNGSAEESALAKRSLACVDDVLDEYGKSDLEFRHPNISTEVPWPQVDMPT